MNFRCLRGFACALAFAVAFVAGSAAHAQTVLKIAHTDRQQSARHAGSLMFAKKVEELTGGRYKVQVFCCSQLGNDPKLVEQVALGGIDFTVTSVGSYAPHIPTLNLTFLPFLFENYEHGWKFYDESQWLKAQYAKAPAKGFRLLATWESGFRHMTTKDPLNSPADAKGKKIRGWANEMVLWSLESMGFGVQIIPVPEVYMAIQQGAVIGQENPIDVIYSQKYQEVAPNVTLTGHIYSPTPIAISEKTWAKLSAADQQAITRAAQEVAPFMRETIKTGEEVTLKEMEAKGARINRQPDIAAFRKAVEPVYAKARDKYGADADAIVKEASLIRAAAR